MTYVISLFIYGYIFFASWTDAFSLGPWFPIPNVILLIIFGLYFPYLIIRGAVPKLAFVSEDLIFFVFLVWVFLTAIISVNEKTLNYILAYFFTFGIGYLVLKMAAMKISFQVAMKVNAGAVVFVSLFVVITFWLRMFTDIDVYSYMLRTAEANATYLGVFYRAYGFSNEPTNLAHYLNTFGPICVWYIWHTGSSRFFVKPMLFLTIFFAWLFTFSAAGFLFLLLSIIITFFLWFIREGGKQTFSLFSFLTGFLILATVLMSTSYFKDDVGTYLLPLIDKVTMQQGGDGDRLSRWVEGIEVVQKHPVLGVGPGLIGGRQEGSTVNWYLLLAAESGIFAVGLILLFLFFSLIRIVQANVAGQYLFLVGFLSSAMHLFVVSTFYNPFLWLLLVLFFVARRELLSRRELLLGFVRTH